MAPLSQALSPQIVESSLSNGHLRHTYHGTVDPDWARRSFSHGGYVLCLLLAACMDCQQKTEHRDPIHITAHFMQPTVKSGYRVEIEAIRTGSRLSNLTANLVQDGDTKVMAHMIFGTLPAFDAPPSSNKYEDITPEHPLYRTIPLLSHPGTVSPEDNLESSGWRHARFGDDPLLVEHNKSKLIATPGTHDGGLESGSWWDILHDEAGIQLSMIPLFADVFESTHSLLSKAHGDGAMPMWYATVVMSLEFKRKFPPRGTPGYAPHTLGVYSKGSFLEQGRHDMYAEVWTAPSSIGEGDVQGADNGSWKQNMRCIAVASQMALSVPLVAIKSKGEMRASL